MTPDGEAGEPAYVVSEKAVASKFRVRNALSWLLMSNLTDVATLLLVLWSKFLGAENLNFTISAV